MCLKMTLRPAEPKNKGSRRARFMTSTWDRMNGRSASGVHAPNATMPTSVCTCSRSVMRPGDVEGGRIVVCGLWFVIWGRWFVYFGFET